MPGNDTDITGGTNGTGIRRPRGTPGGWQWYERAVNEPNTVASDEVVEICRDLIRMDTTNTGDNDTSAGERVAAEYVAEKLAEVGLEPVMRGSVRGRASVFARYP